MLGVVETTIGKAENLVGYAENFSKYGRTGVFFVIVGDRKTPLKANWEIAREITDLGYICDFLPVIHQKEWLRTFPKLDGILPWNSDNRRNLGYVYAACNGADKILVLDDDNYVSKTDCYQHHVGDVGLKVGSLSASTGNGWFNPCSLLESIPNVPVYMRGFPFSKRCKDTEIMTNSVGKPVVNVGLWAGTPDVDALTHLMYPHLESKEFTFPENIMLKPRVYAPVNTQNTCFLTEILPCFYFWPMLRGMSWFGDVFGGLFARKIIDHLGDTVQYGRPLSIHDRMPRDELQQLSKQLRCMLFHEELCEVVPNIELEGKSYADASLELIAKLASTKFKTGWAGKYLERVMRNFWVWVEVCDKVL